jgi:hypothetical protein
METATKRELNRFLFRARDQIHAILMRFLLGVGDQWFFIYLIRYFYIVYNGLKEGFSDHDETGGHGISQNSHKFIVQRHRAAVWWELDTIMHESRVPARVIFRG